MPAHKKKGGSHRRQVGRSGKSGRYKKDCFVYNSKTKKFTMKKKGTRRKTRGGNIFQQSSKPQKKKKKTTKKKKGGNIFQGDKPSSRPRPSRPRPSRPRPKPPTINVFQLDRPRPSKPAFVSPALMQSYQSGVPMNSVSVSGSQPEPVNLNIFQNDKTPPISFSSLSVLDHILGG